MSLFIAVALLAGAMLPLQAAINSRLGHALGSPLWAAATSALISAVVLFIAGFAVTGALPRNAGVQTLPLWAWTGGLCGVVTLAGVTASTSRLGAGALMALVIAGQVIFSMAIDRFGLFGLPAHPLSLQRGVAVCLLLAGSVLLQ